MSHMARIVLLTPDTEKKFGANALEELCVEMEMRAEEWAS